MYIVLFFTRGVTLKAWDETGVLEREIEIYRRLQSQGVKVSIVTYGDTGDLNYSKALQGIQVLPNRMGFPSRIYEILIPFLHRKQLSKADVYKTNQTNGAVIALRAARIYRKPLVARSGYIWSRFVAKQKGEESPDVVGIRHQEKTVFTEADRIVVTAEHMKQYLMEQYDLDEKKISIIPNYVLTDTFAPDPGISYKPGVISFVGRLQAQKNLFALFEAVDGLDVNLNIIGDGPLLEALQSTASEKGVEVNFRGICDHENLPIYLNASQIFVLPSLYEGHPKVLLEAMSCGRPVVASEIPSTRNLIRHRDTGYLCGTTSQEIRAAIQDVLSEAEAAEQIGRNARKFVVENFSLDAVLQKEFTMLQDVMVSPVNSGWSDSIKEASRMILGFFVELLRYLWNMMK